MGARTAGPPLRHRRCRVCPRRAPGNAARCGHLRPLFPATPSAAIPFSGKFAQWTPIFWTLFFSGVFAFFFLTDQTDIFSSFFSIVFNYFRPLSRLYLNRLARKEYVRSSERKLGGKANRRKSSKQVARLQIRTLPKMKDCYENIDIKV